MQTVEDVMDRDPQLKERKYFVPVQHSGAGLVSVHNWGFKLSKTPAEFRSAPILGEHNYAICTQLLGMTDEGFVGLVQTKVLE